MKKNNIIISLIPALISLLLLIGVMTVFSACGMKDDGTWMHCHDAQNAVAACAGIMTVLLTAAAFIKNRGVLIVLYAAGIAAAAVAFLFPGIINSMCMMNTMRCHSLMKPFVRVMTVIIAVLSVRGLVSAAKNRM